MIEDDKVANTMRAAERLHTGFARGLNAGALCVTALLLACGDGNSPTTEGSSDNTTTTGGTTAATGTTDSSGEFLFDVGGMIEGLKGRPCASERRW